MKGLLFSSISILLYPRYNCVFHVLCLLSIPLLFPQLFLLTSFSLLWKMMSCQMLNDNNKTIAISLSVFTSSYIFSFVTVQCCSIRWLVFFIWCFYVSFFFSISSHLMKRYPIYSICSKLFSRLLFLFSNFSMLPLS